jgi:hypothetical protein
MINRTTINPHIFKTDWFPDLTARYNPLIERLNTIAQIKKRKSGNRLMLSVED